MNQTHMGRHNNNGGWAHSETASKQISETMKRTWNGENGKAARKKISEAMKRWWKERKRS
jgi:hypothetical protein